MSQLPPFLSPDGDPPRKTPVVRTPDAVSARVSPNVVLPSYVAGGSGTMPAAATDDLTVANILRMVLRRWTVAVPVFVAVMAVTWWRYSLETPTYQASTTIRIDKSKEAIPGMSNNAMLGYTSPYELSTEIQVLQSRAIAEEVAARTDYALRMTMPRMARSAIVDSVQFEDAARRGSYVLTRKDGAALTLTGPSGAPVPAKVGEWVVADGLRLLLKPTALDHQEVHFDLIDNASAASGVRGSLNVSQPVRDAEILRLTVRDGDPKVAARVADATAEVFTASQTRRRQAGGRTTVSFIRAQLDTLDRQLIEAEIKLRDWRAQQKVVVPGAEAGNAVAQRAAYEERVAERRQELANIEVLLATAPGAAAATNEGARIQKGFRTVLSSPVMKGTAAGNSILSTLLELESKRAELKLRRTDEDSEVQVLDKTIADYERQGQLFVGSYVSALRTEISGFESALGRVGSRLERFPGQELELTTLQRNAEVLATLQGTLRTRLKESEITNASNEANVEILDRAVAPGGPVSPVLSRYVAVGGVAAVLLALLAAVLRDKMDRTIHTREDIERATGAPLIGLIPSFSTGRSAVERMKGRRRLARGAASAKSASSKATARATATALEPTPLSPASVFAGGYTRPAIPVSGENLIAINAPRHVAAEAYRMLRTNLRFAPAEQSRQVLTISSPSPGDGKSTTALNFAATLAVQGKRILLIDGDMRRGTQHKLLGLSRTPGLSDVLIGQLRGEQAMRTVQLADGVTMDFIACGNAPPNPAELLGSSSAASLYTWAKANYDTVIVDTPPVNMFADGLLLATASDALILIGRAGKSFRDELTMAAEQLRNVNVPLAGVVLNDFDVKRDNRFGSAYYQYDRYYHKYYASYMQPDESGTAA